MTTNITAFLFPLVVANFLAENCAAQTTTKDMKSTKNSNCLPFAIFVVKITSSVQARVPRVAKIVSGWGIVDTDCAEATGAISLFAKPSLTAQLRKFAARGRELISLSSANGEPRVVDL